MTRPRPIQSRLYEGMFLVDPQAGATQWAKVQEEVSGLLTRNGGKIRLLKKWDERKLAYSVRGRSRGTYVLAYFDAPPSAVAKVKTEMTHSENILRTLLVVHDDRVPKDLRRATEAAAPPEAPAPAPAKA